MLARKTIHPFALLVLFLLPGAGCLRSIALGAAANALAATGNSYSSDEDPELIAAAAPFGLKTMEQVLAEKPEHVGLLTALVSGFTAYAVVFVGQDADEMDEKDVERGKVLHLRARKLLLRARGYGLRGLEVNHPGFIEAFKTGGPDSAPARAKLLAAMTKDDVKLLYWTGASWALAIASKKDDMKLVGELPLVEELMTRALQIDEGFDRGSIHEFFVAYDASRDETAGGGPAKSKEHLDRALALAKNEKLGVLVSFAESVCVGRQDKAEFTRLLTQVVSFDVDSAPNDRLPNLLAQRRARWLLGRTADLFAE